jgi:uncharacterized membrane protein YbhN (UPF0104 family)
VALRALIAGQITNALSPVRAGEAVRLGMLTAHGGALVPGAAALAGSKAMDTVCLAAIAFAVAGTAVFSHPNLGLAAGILVIAAGGALAVWGDRVRGRLERHAVARRLRLVSLVDVAHALHDPAVLGAVTGATVVVWMAGLAANGLVLAAVGAAPSLTLAARVIVAGYLVSMLPSPPAQLGTFEAAVTVALTSAGIAVETALAAAVVLHVCQFIKLGILLVVSLLLTRLPRAAWVRWSAGS